MAAGKKLHAAIGQKPRMPFFPSDEVVRVPQPWAGDVAPGRPYQ
jgi:hypothetical protein